MFWNILLKWKKIIMNKIDWIFKWGKRVSTVTFMWCFYFVCLEVVQEYLSRYYMWNVNNIFFFKWMLFEFILIFCDIYEVKL